MMDKERVPDTTYRIIHRSNYYEITAYPTSETDEEGNATKVHTGTYREDVIPEWVRMCMQLLDTAGSGYEVPTVGAKIGDTYWLHSKDFYGAALTRVDRLIRWVENGKKTEGTSKE